MEGKTKGGINIPGVNERKNKEKGLTFLVRMEGKTNKKKTFRVALGTTPSVKEP